MIRKLLFLLMLCVTSVGAWGQTSSSVYKFTQKAADGGLYTDDQGTAATGIVSGQIFSGNYYVLEDQYTQTGAGVPATSTEKVFNVKTYYVKNADVYSTAFEKAYNASNQYATVNSTETRQLDFTASTTQDYEDYIDAENKYAFNSQCDYICEVTILDGETVISDVNKDYGLDKVKLTPVSDGYAFDEDKMYVKSYNCTTQSFVNEILYNPNSKNTSAISYALEQKTFESFKSSAIGNVYVENDGIYTAITSAEYTSGTPYFTVSFDDIAIADNETTIGSQDIFNTTKTVVLGAGEELYYRADGTEYTPVTNGDIFQETGAYYTKEQVYNPKSVGQLIALGYVSEETSLYMCDVEKDGNTITISYDSSHSYGSATKSLADYVKECPSDISGYQNVVFKSNNGGDGTQENIAKIISGINNVTGITNLVFDELTVYGGNIGAYDFTTLTNPSVKRIILPAVGANNDSFSDVKTKLNTVIEHNATTKPVLEVVGTFGSGEDAVHRCFVYSPEEGSLAAIKDAHYYSTNISNCTRQVYTGYVGGEDYIWFNGVNVSELNLSGLSFRTDAELADLKETIHNLDNDVVEYIALPVFDALPVEPLYKDLRAYCSNLIAVGQFVYTDDKVSINYEEVSAGALNMYSKTPGNIEVITNMLADVTSNNKKVVEAKISGNLNAADIANGNDYLMAGGHAMLMEWSPSDRMAVLSDQTQDTKAKSALDSHNLKSLDLEDAYFPVNSDFNPALVTAVGNALKDIKLPTHIDMKLLPAGALANLKGLTEICIPYNFEEIGAGAFTNSANINHVTTTDVEGNEVDNGDLTLTLSANMKQIRSGAFFSVDNVYDVYVMATTAPKCEKDAFDAASLVGWGGFNSTAPITRNSYLRASDMTFAILHYPSNTSEAEIKNYVDATRVYSIPDGLQTTDANGKLIYWPSQVEYNHYENDAVYGYIWNDVTATDPSKLGADQVDRGGSGTRPTGTVWSTDVTVKDSPTRYNYEDYMGWHQFVLIYASNGVEDEEKPKWDFSNIYDNEWWTICVPFDMTKRDLINVFGTSAQEAKDSELYTDDDVNAWVDAQNAPYQVRDAEGNQPGTTEYTPTYPSDYTPMTAADCPFHVNDIKVPGQAAREELSPVLCTLERVIRNSNTETITFGFGQDLVKDNADDTVILKAGKAYMIKPNMPEEFVNSTFMPGSHVVEYTPKFTSSTVYPLYNTTISAVDQNGADTQVKYNFVGTYVPQKMPAHSFFLGWDASNAVSHVAYYHQKNISTKDSWKAYTAIIVPEMGTEAHYTATTGTSTVLDYYTVTSGNDDFGTSQAKAAAIFVDYDGGEITSINGTPVGTSVHTSNIYNLNGQKVADGNDFSKLAKGIYIVNGKKQIKK